MHSAGDWLFPMQGYQKARGSQTQNGKVSLFPSPELSPALLSHISIILCQRETLLISPLRDFDSELEAGDDRINDPVTNLDFAPGEKPDVT